MKLTNKRREISLLALSFLIPVGIVLFYMIAQGYYPFGNYSYGISDNYHQYMPFFLDFRRNILNGDSLLYNWNIGMGIDYLGLIPYYLASPLNLLSVLFSEQGAITYYSLLMPLRLGFASTFFAVFLWKACGKLDFSLPLFGSFYGMCAWALGYQWNCMWLDTFAITPLVILGAINLLKHRRFILYTTALFFAIAANYYIGFFVCIFVLLTFICFQICEWSGWRKMIRDALVFALYSILAIGMTAVITIPAFAALQKTYSSVNQFPSGFQLNITDQNTWVGLLDAMAQVAGNTTGGLVPTFKNGLPNLYCGVGTLMLSIIFLSSKQIRKRDRACAGGILLFMAISFIVRQLDYIWHGFHFTNQIPHRFSFLFSFVMLVMAYRMWLKRTTITSWQIYLAMGIIVVLCFLTKANTSYHLVYNFVMMLLYMCIFMLLQNQRKRPGLSKVDVVKRMCDARRRTRKQASWIMVGILFVEIVFNYTNFENHNLIITLEDVPQGKSSAAEVIKYMKENDDDYFYRTEVTHTQTYNDGALNDYHGISTFTSSANVNVTRFMQAMGFAAQDNYNRYLFEEFSPVSNLFLGLKYMISRDNTALDNSYFESMYSKDGITLLKNKAYLPIGFMVDDCLKDLKFEKTDNPFLFQNTLFTCATGIQESVWKDLTDTAIITSEENIEVEIKSGHTTFRNLVANETVTYRYKIVETGLFCFGIDFSNNNVFTVYKNGNKLYKEDEILPQALSLANVKEGDVIDIIVAPTGNEEESLSIYAAILNDDIFQKGYEKLSRNTLDLVKHSNTQLDGTIECAEPGLLYTSIPQNGNWSVLVDGEETEIILVGDAMIGMHLDAGKHEIQFRYTNKAFVYGSIISCAAVCLFGFVIILNRRRHLQKIVIAKESAA